MKTTFHRTALWPVALFTAFILHNPISASAAPASEPILHLASPSFAENGTLSPKYTCAGLDVSPAMTWSGAPVGTKSFALLCDDPDAPGGSWVHWLIYGMPTTTTHLSEHLATTETLADGARQGLNSFRRVGYSGPCPPSGERHRYIFTLYALDDDLPAKPRATKSEFLRAVQGHVLAQARLTGIYRSR